MVNFIFHFSLSLFNFNTMRVLKVFIILHSPITATRCCRIIKFEWIFPSCFSLCALHNHHYLTKSPFWIRCSLSCSQVESKWVNKLAVRCSSLSLCIVQVTVVHCDRESFFLLFLFTVRWWNSKCNQDETSRTFAIIHSWQFTHTSSVVFLCFSHCLLFQSKINAIWCR